MVQAVSDEELRGFAGKILQPSPWHQITQEQIDQFADVTGDHQFIHVDPERAAEGPFGSTIAHGFLTLSLLASLTASDWPELEDPDVSINYGMDKVRFLRPVVVNARVRVQTKILSVTEKRPREFLIRSQKTMEVEGNDKPAYIAIQLALLVGKNG